MSEDFVDVRWRGLEVARKVRLRAAGSRGYVEHGTPMPTGTALTVHTADGHTLTAVVAAVHEQVGGRTEAPGMELDLCAEGAAAAWWQARREVAIAAAAAPVVASESRTRTIPPAELAQAMAASGVASTHEPIAPAPTGEPVAAPTAEARPADEARPTEVMAAVAPPDDADPAPEPAAVDGEPGATAGPTDSPPESPTDSPTESPTESPTGSPTEGPPDGPPEGPPEGVPVELADDGRHTAVMAAVDIEAIVAAGVAEAVGRDDDAGAAASGDKKKGPRGKRKRGR